MCLGDVLKPGTRACTITQEMKAADHGLSTRKARQSLSV